MDLGQRGTCWLSSCPHAGARCGSICSVLSSPLFNLLEVGDQPEGQAWGCEKGHRGYLIEWDLGKLAAGEGGLQRHRPTAGTSLHDFS